MKAQNHWEKVYRESDPTADVSWFQAHPAMSLQMIRATGVQRQQPVIDIGAGAGRLVDCLLEEGFKDLSVLDISPAAVQHARERLGARAEIVHWFVEDVLLFQPPRQYSLWHDRALFHFLVSAADRSRYIEVMRRALAPGGHVVIGTFAEDGPTRCSGLPTVRYDAASIRAELGAEFELCEQQREHHFTPWKTEQRFNWFRFRRESSAGTSDNDLTGNMPAQAGTPSVEARNAIRSHKNQNNPDHQQL